MISSPIIKKKSKVKSIGGCIESDFLTLKSLLHSINEKKIPFLRMLGIAPDLQAVLRLIALPLSELEEALIKRVFADIEAGRIKKETLLSTKSKKEAVKNDSTEESPIGNEQALPLDEEPGLRQRRKRGALSETTKIRMRIKQKFKERCSKDKRLALWEPERAVWKLELVKEALSLSEDGIEVNERKFIELYQNHIQASESEIQKLHQTAANALNAFFAGIPITQEELRLYFILEDGLVKPNPLSITLEAYSRLGGRKTKVKIVEQ